MVDTLYEPVHAPDEWWHYNCLNMAWDLYQVSISTGTGMDFTWPPISGPNDIPSILFPGGQWHYILNDDNHKLPSINSQLAVDQLQQMVHKDVNYKPKLIAG